jgi:N-ethylmaleimide reductase
MANLYEPTTVGSIEVANRVFLAPLTRNRSKDDFSPNDLAPEYYSQRASGGLLITEASQISPEGIGYINTPGIFSEAQVEGWKKVTDAVHAKGGKIVVQLWHVGRISHTSLQPNAQAPLAPSAVRANSQTFIATGMVDVSEPREMTLEDIQRTVADYKRAAENAKRAGFDGIEVHSANGYLIDQFLMDGVNQRTDGYGGSVENRYRFLSEVMAAVLSVWPADKVGVRLSPTGQFNDASDSDRLATYGYAVKQLNTLGLAYLHIVEKFPGIEQSDDDRATLGALIDMWDGFYIANGDYGKADGEAAVAEGRAGAVAYGRPFLANPDLPRRLALGAALNDPNPATFYGGGAEGYTDYPTLDEG